MERLKRSGARVLGLALLISAAAVLTSPSDAAHRPRPRCSTPLPHYDCSNLSGTISDVLVDPRQPNTVVMFAPGGYEWLSRNAGRSWSTQRLRFPSNVNLTVNNVFPATQEWAFSSDGTIVKPYVSRSIGQPFGIATSTDLGKTWQLWPQPPSAERLSDNERPVPDPSTPGSLWDCGLSGNVAHSVDGGQTWSFSHPFGGGDCQTVAVQPGGKVLLADVSIGAASKEAFYRSTDSGETWSRVASVHPSSPGHSAWLDESVVFNPAKPRVVLALGGALGDGSSRILRSTDAGATWRRAKMPRRPKLCGYWRLAFSSDGTAVAVANCGSRAGINGVGRLFVSSRGGSKWRLLSIPRNPTAKLGGDWAFEEGNGGNDPSMSLLPQGKSILFYSAHILTGLGTNWAPAPFWRLSANHRSMTWWGSWRAVRG